MRRLARDVGAAERRAHLATDRFRLLVDAAGAAIVAVTTDGTVVLWNHAAERLFGWTAQEAVGRRSFWVPEEEMADHAQVLRRVAAGDVLEPQLRRRMRRDGTAAWVRLTATAMRDADGTQLLVAVMEDVTRQTAAEQERDETATWNRIMFDGSPLPMYVVDPTTGRYLDANDAAAAVCAKSVRQLTELTIDEHMGGGTAERIRRLVAEDAPEEAMVIRTHHVHDDLSERDLEITARRVAFGERHLWLVIATDVTEREAAERRRQELFDRLEALHAIDAEVLQGTSAEDMARRAVSRIRQLVPCDRASVTFLEPGAETLRMVAVDERRPLGPAVGAVLPLADAFPGLAEDRTGRLLIPDTGAMPPRPGESAALADWRRDGIRAGLSVGLRANGVQFGRLNLFSLVPDAFPPPSIDVTCELADQLAIALSQARYRDDLVASEQRFRRVLDASPNATLVYARDGTIRYANQVTSALFGAHPDSIPGSRVDQFIPGATAAPVARQDRDKPGIEGRVEPAHFDGSATRADGTTFPVDLSLSPLLTVDGPMTIATVVDLSERVALEDQFRQAQKMEVMGRFANILAHDFRNYLTAIGGFAELLEDALAKDDPRREDATEIIGVVARASDLIRNMLAFARPDSAQTPATTDVAAHLRQNYGLLRRILPFACRLDYSLASGLPAAAIAPSALIQVLANLTSNARDAMRGREGALIEITVDGVDEALAGGDEALAGGDEALAGVDEALAGVDEALAGVDEALAGVDEALAGVDEAPAGGADDAATGVEAPESVQPTSAAMIRIRFRDNGAGMDDVTMRRAFEPFYTTKDAREMPGSGTGLGLSSIQAIIRRAHGSISVESEVGVGTTFTILLPVATPQPLSDEGWHRFG